MKKLKVAVLMGGLSCEREVSLVSGKGVLENLNKNKYEAVGVDVPSELPKLNKTKFDLAFVIMHGKGGEDGEIQGYLETLGIKYIGCGVLASAMGMNKKFFKWVMEHNDILMPKTNRKIPCVVKPVCGGSSVGVSIVEEDRDLESAIKLAKKYDQEIIIEEYIKGTEVTCGVWGNKKVEALPVVEIIPKNKFFDYESKYSDGGAQEICPARLNKEITKKIQGIAIKVFKIIGGKDFARVDMMVRNGEIYVLDINTLPGLTPNSLLPKEAKAVGYSYSQMLDKMIELGLNS
ncbi:MAG: D-alanine--D-alanine ligase [Candidatus Shapirobacteria bacterium]|jgi:D-alanine-D-alanine ligase